MKSRVAILIAAFAALPLSLRAQGSAEKPAPAQTQTQTQGQAQAQSPQTRIDAAFQAAAQARIPVSLLRSKVAEGQAKHVPAQRVATAVEARLQALMTAQQAMKRAHIESSSESELAVTADALQAGVGESALVKVYRSAPAERRVVAVAVLADLVRLGEASSTAVARVSSAAESGVALANLQAQVASQLRLGGLSSTLDATGIVRVK
ncbi:MAG TPA: hypothetical protein VF021_03440 [Longimicrobiales bacterium]